MGRVIFYWNPPFQKYFLWERVIQTFQGSIVDENTMFDEDLVDLTWDPPWSEYYVEWRVD